jgi:hypothetical protein
MMLKVGFGFIVGGGRGGFMRGGPRGGRGAMMVREIGPPSFSILVSFIKDMILKF